MEKEYEIEFYKKIASEIKPKGFRCFLYNEGTSVWLCIITPNNSWLSVDNAEFSGFNIDYEYEPSRDFGSGCRYNEHALNEITSEILFEAEEYGRNFGSYVQVTAPNRFNTGIHREKVWRKPNHYPNAYKAMMNSWCADKLKEI